jgi:dihydroneopterin aldolase
MSCIASIELRNLKLQTHIGIYKPGDIIPNEHLLDLTLWIDSKLILISEDSMTKVFDYDPLIATINDLAGETHYETQERLVSRIVDACLAYSEIQALEISLRKSPVSNNSGSLGVKMSIDKTALFNLKNMKKSAP